MTYDEKLINTCPLVLVSKDTYVQVCICYLFPTLGLALFLGLGLIQLFILTLGKEFGGLFLTLIASIL